MSVSERTLISLRDLQIKVISQRSRSPGKKILIFQWDVLIGISHLSKKQQIIGWPTDHFFRGISTSTVAGKLFRTSLLRLLGSQKPMPCWPILVYWFIEKRKSAISEKPFFYVDQLTKTDTNMSVYSKCMLFHSLSIGLCWLWGLYSFVAVISKEG